MAIYCNVLGHIPRGLNWTRSLGFQVLGMAWAPLASDLGEG